MMTKVISILGSVRFWMITVATASVITGHYFPDAKFFFDQVGLWLAAVAAVGTLDKFSTPQQ